MAEQHEHSAQFSQEAMLRKHQIQWDKVRTLDEDTKNTLQRFLDEDYRARSPEGDKNWCNLLNSDEAAPRIAHGLMSVLASDSTNSTDVAHLALVLDDLIQDDRKHVMLFRGDNLERHLEILIGLLERHDHQTTTESDLLNQRLMHVVAVLFYPGLSYGEAADPNSAQMMRFATICRDRLVYTDTKNSSMVLKGILHALSALQVLLREQQIRAELDREFSFHRHCTLLLQPDSKLLKDHQNNNQLLYQLAFCLWLLSYDAEIADKLKATDIVPNMLRVMRDVTKEKVLRVCVACFRNLVNIEEHNEMMIRHGALKQLVILRNKTWSDEEVVEDLQVVADSLAKSVKILSSVEKYRHEVNSGQLQWTPVHKSESFFRENAEKFAPLGKAPTEFTDLILLCKLLRDKYAVQHPDSQDLTTMAVICHDLGEFARWHPRGKRILSEDDKHGLWDDNLGSTKSIIMKLMTDHNDSDINKNALTCIHKMMVNNWQFLEPGR